jgi:hypothetical protein
MAKDTSELSTSAEAPAEKPQRTFRFKLPPEQAEFWRKWMMAERASLERAAQEQSKLDEDRKFLNHYIAVRDGMIPPPWRAQPVEALQRPQPVEVPLTPLPTTRPMGIGPKVWATAQAIVELRRAGAPVDRGLLLDKVVERIGSVSLRTLAEALMHLRRGGHVPR